MLTIHITKILSSEAEGYVYADQLTPLQLKKLNTEIEDDNGFCNEAKVHIEYSVQWDDDLAMVTIEDVVLYNDTNGSDFGITLRDTDYNYDDVSIKLESDGPYPNWMEDRNDYFESQRSYYDEE